MNVFRLLFLLAAFTITMTTALSTAPPQNTEIRIAFLGNSIIYFNDCPRLLEHMLRSKYSTVVQDSCLRGGASLPSLWRDGNGMRNKFGASEQAKRDDGSLDFGAATVQDLLSTSTTGSTGATCWNYVVLNDYTQAPARPKNRLATMEALEQLYGPLLKSTTPILLQTAAYRRPINGSEDLGTVTEFTTKLKEGYALYATTLTKFSPDTKVAPVGDAFLYVHDNAKELWNKLFYVDDFHPSPHGTWLQACVVYCTITGEKPPTFPLKLWSARYMQPKTHTSSVLPSAEDAETLRQAACVVCGIVVSS